MTRKRSGWPGIVVACLVAGTAVGCASARPKPPLREFTEADLGGLVVGMNARDARSRYGAPAVVFKADFGADVGEKWEGVVYEYWGQDDSTYKFATRKLKSRLVFVVEGGDTLLNHWDIERPQPK